MKKLLLLIVAVVSILGCKVDILELTKATEQVQKPVQERTDKIRLRAFLVDPDYDKN